MNTKLTNQQIENNYNAFVKELTRLSRKYGVAITSIGGVVIADQADQFKNMEYVADPSSGDLFPREDYQDAGESK